MFNRNPYMDDLVRYAESFLGVPYVWGGNTRQSLDCSGYINIVLRSVGLIGLSEDLTAMGLYDKFEKSGMPLSVSAGDFVKGSLLFYGKSINTIEHVAFVKNPYTILECGGGNRNTNSIEIARKINAEVREMGILLRHDIVANVLPPYPWNGTYLRT